MYEEPTTMFNWSPLFSSTVQMAQNVTGYQFIYCDDRLFEEGGMIVTIFTKVFGSEAIFLTSPDFLKCPSFYPFIFEIVDI